MPLLMPLGVDSSLQLQFSCTGLSYHTLEKIGDLKVTLESNPFNSLRATHIILSLCSGVSMSE